MCASAMFSTASFLHVANGSDTTDTIQLAGIPGKSSIWADPLHDGPVPGGLSDEQLLDVRARYFASAYNTAYTPEQCVEILKSWRTSIDDTSAYDELVLWYEHDLFDQLNLLQVLTYLRRAGPRQRSVTLICVGSFPGRPRFKGLGELTPDELASLLDTRRPVTEEQYALAERTWTAFRATDPREVERVVRGDSAALPFLAAALERFLEEFPSTTHGLSRTEHRLMTLTASGSLDLATAFPQMHDDETAFYIADLSFRRVVHDLASATPPLLNADVSSAPASRHLRGSVALTDTGREVLEGKVDRIRACGLDRWLGGVHLTGHGPLWRWDDAHDRLVYA